MTQHSRKNVNRKVYQQKQQHKKGWEIVKIKKKTINVHNNKASKN